jgi:1-acyl-sn-glycerol-3-phosphate acyltransferase
LSYLDILVISSLTPAVFVAKHEIKSWPVFGWLASMAGTLYVQREKKRDVARVNPEMDAVLGNGVLLVLFPEGTSSDARTVLPFKSSLLEPAAHTQLPVTAGCIGYTLADGDAGNDVCYWGDMTLVPHLVNLLSRKKVEATIRFQQLNAPSSDRKELTRQLQVEVLRLKGK